MTCLQMTRQHSSMTVLNRDKSYQEVTAMVIGVQPVGEYDRRVVLLTRERGKIACFARGARRPNSSLIAGTDLFAFGTFRFYAGRDAYVLTEASIQNYFSWFRSHIEASLVGQYFCEVLEYCTRENNDEAQLLLLLYQSLRALQAEKMTIPLVRAVFELKTVTIEGELREPAPGRYLPAVSAAMNYIAGSSIGKLYSFEMESHAASELEELAAREMSAAFEHHHFKSLEILKAMGII